MIDDVLYKRLESEYDQVITDTLNKLKRTQPLTKQQFYKILFEANKLYWLTRLATIDEYTVLTAEKVGAALTVPYINAANE